MIAKVKRHFDEVLSHLYINPLEKCNLRCKICYTRKSAPILSKKEIWDFVGRYQKAHKLETITFCGGEVFTLPYFTGLVNKLTLQSRYRISQIPHLNIDSVSPATKYQLLEKHVHSGIELRSSKLVSSTADPLFVQIITNGTIDRLDEFENPNMVNLIVSLDGLPEYHDKNRGKGNFPKSLTFLKKAQKLGFHAEIFSIITRQNLCQIPQFEQYIYSQLGSNLQITYHPRKQKAYLLSHPQSNVFGDIKGFDFLTDKEMAKIIKERKTFPPKKLGCFQISLMSDGKVYGCCEGTVPLGNINDKIEILIGNLKERLKLWDKENKISGCLGCSQPEFMCGIKEFTESGFLLTQE